MAGLYVVGKEFVYRKKTNKTINRWVTDKSGIIEGYHKWVEMFPPGYNFMFGLRRLRRF